MKFHTFSGETPTEAFKKAQLECGEDALVISTKQLRKKTISTTALYEIVVAIDDEKDPLFEKPTNTHTSYELDENSAKEDVFSSFSEVTKQISQLVQTTQQPIQNITPIKEPIPAFIAPSSQPSEGVGDLKQELTKLSDKVQLIQEMFWQEKAPSRNYLAIPPEFAQIYKIAKVSGMDEGHLESIMSLTLEHMPTRMRSSSETIKRYFQILLRKLVPVRLELEQPKGAKRIMMFVGPTGVGKTTTIAKLAARYSYIQEKRLKVGIITLDTYRIGAVEQLFQYAKMMRLPIEDVVELGDFNGALSSLAHCDVILIDTVGSSQYDKEKLEKLNSFIQSSEYQIDVNLVLSAGSKLEDLKEIYKNFSFLNIDTLIVTKFDETKAFGTIFSLVYETDKPLSYFSIGQEVPDDLIPASSEFLVECMLEGFKKKRGEDGNTGK